MSSIFFSEKEVYSEIYIHHWYIICTVQTVFPQSPLHYPDNVFTFALDAVRRQRKTLCCSVGDLHERCFTSSSSTKDAVGVHPAGRQRDGRQRVVNRDYREDEEDPSITLLQVAPLCAEWCTVWSCHAVRELGSSSCLSEPFEFVVLAPLTTAHTRVVQKVSDVIFFRGY